MRNIEFPYCFFNSLNTFIRVINDVLSPSQEVFTAYTDKIGYNIFGQTITIYIINSIFNAIVSEIDDVEDKSKKVYFPDTDVKPMYRGYSGFLPQEAAIEDQNNIRIKIQEYKQAKKIDEYLKMLIDDSIGEGEVKC